jgi:hypothetical protein
MYIKFISYFGHCNIKILALPLDAVLMVFDE